MIDADTLAKILAVTNVITLFGWLASTTLSLEVWRSVIKPKIKNEKKERYGTKYP